MWYADEVTGRVVWSPLRRRILGVSDAIPASYNAFLSAVHPDDRDAVNTEISQGVC